MKQRTGNPAAQNLFCREFIRRALGLQRSFFWVLIFLGFGLFGNSPETLGQGLLHRATVNLDELVDASCKRLGSLVGKKDLGADDIRLLGDIVSQTLRERESAYRRPDPREWSGFPRQATCRWFTVLYASVIRRLQLPDDKITFFEILPDAAQSLKNALNQLPLTDVGEADAMLKFTLGNGRVLYLETTQGLASEKFLVEGGKASEQPLQALPASPSLFSQSPRWAEALMHFEQRIQEERVRYRLLRGSPRGPCR